MIAEFGTTIEDVAQSKTPWCLFTRDVRAAFEGVYPDWCPFDLIFADPPYGRNKHYDNYDDCDIRTNADYRRWVHTWMGSLVHGLASQGSIWIMVSEDRADHMGSLLSEYLPRVNRIIWHETFAQYRQDRFTNAHRHLFWHADPGFTWNPDAIRVESARQRLGDKRANPRGRVPGDVWNYSRVCGTFHERCKWHPAQLPLSLMERIILCSTRPGDLVLDPFSGTATTGVAALKHGRRYIGIDISGEYNRLAAERLQAAEETHRG